MINRHNITRDILSELEIINKRFLKNKIKLPKRIKKGLSVNLNSYKDTPLEMGLFSIINSKHITDISEYLKSYIDLGISHLQREFCLESSLKIEISNEEFVIESSTSKIGINLFDWWKLFNVALILRDDKFKNELYDLFSNCKEETKDPFWRKSMMLVLMCNDKEEFETSILSDIKSIVKSGVVEYHSLQGGGLIKSKEGKGKREKMWFPVMELYYLAYLHDENAFNTLLEEYLIFKKKWIIENKEEDNSNYWIDFPLLACCSYAHDKSISISVESEYIPSFIFKREVT